MGAFGGKKFGIAKRQVDQSVHFSPPRLEFRVGKVLKSRIGFCHSNLSSVSQIGRFFLTTTSDDTNTPHDYSLALFLLFQKTPNEETKTMTRATTLFSNDIFERQEHPIRLRPGLSPGLATNFSDIFFRAVINGKFCAFIFQILLDFLKRPYRDYRAKNRRNFFRKNRRERNRLKDLPTSNFAPT